CYTELLPPTAVTHAVALPLLSPAANNLVVAKTSLLQVFDVLPTPDGHTRLSLVAEYPLSGTVTALRALTLPPGTHALLLATKDAKLSLLEWDAANHRISTISIHYYEGDNVRLPPFGPSLAECDSVLTVDPSSRCAALQFGQRQLAILPFRHASDDVADDGSDDGLDTAMGGQLKRTSTNLTTTSPEEPAGEGAEKPTPYAPSFVLPTTALDPALTHPIHLAFLHAYREPTFGILSSRTAPSDALREERRDAVTFALFTLDLAQRASTNLLSVPNLPSDLWKVVPLALPVGGALLVGRDEVVHVDQGGKVCAVGVNEFAKRGSGLSMVDQSRLVLRLEGCEVEVLDPATGDLLLVLRNGSLAVLSFKLLGRNIGGMTITRVAAAHGGRVNASAPSCAVGLPDQHVFVGSEDGNSSLLRWTKSTATLSRKRSHAQMLEQADTAPALTNDDDDDDDEAAEEDVDEDDLYAPTAESIKRTASLSRQTALEAGATYSFELRDSLRSLGPINEFCLGKSPGAGVGKLELVAGIGRGRASRLAVLRRAIVPREVRGWAVQGAVQGAWSLDVRPRDSPDDAAADSGLLFASDGTATRVYRHPTTTAAADAALEELTETDFEGEGAALSLCTLAQDSIVVHARRTEIRTYDHELGLSQIIPMNSDDEDAEEGEVGIVGVSVCDPYLLVLREDSLVVILKVDTKGEVEPLELEGSALGAGKWLSGCLLAGHIPDVNAGAKQPAAAVWMLNPDGGLQVFALPGLEQVYAAPTLPFLPPVLAADAPMRRGGKVALTELLLVELGTEEVRRPYLLVRTGMDDLVLYEPFHLAPPAAPAAADAAATAVGEQGAAWAGLRFRKVPLNYLPKYDEGIDTGADGRPAPLQAVTV
ncbi:mRNA cleavage and polyadenylation factor subunit, partial [Teratosphaeriaceae sp. CCFEE 6253]